MGTWGMGTFEDDDALDWLHDLEEQGLPILERALSMQLPEYLSAPDGQVLLAAAEVVAAMKGSPADDLPDAIDDWLRVQHAGAAHRLAPLAAQRVERVLGQHSELNDLWKENDEEYPEWRAYVLDLRRRLNG